MKRRQFLKSTAAIAGTPQSTNFDNASKVFTLTYVPRVSTAPTEIFVPARHYPNGYQVSVQGGQVVSAPGATLRVWNRRNPGTFDIFENTVTPTATLGLFTFKWEPYPSVTPLNPWDDAKFLKAYAPGYTAKAQLEWIFDAQRDKCLYGLDVYRLTIRLTAVP